MIEKRLEHVVGIDPSYSGLGVVVIDEKGRHAAQCFRCGPRGKGVRGRVARVAELCGMVNEMIDGLLISAIAIEDYVVMREQPATTISTVELCFSLRFDLSQHPYPVDDGPFPIMEVPAASLKKFVAGRGDTRGALKVTKDVMRNAVAELYGENFGNDNIVDAYGLAQFAAVSLGWWKPKNQKQADVIAALLSVEVEPEKTIATMNASTAKSSDSFPF